ncbi:DUF1800 domain-containing protein [Quadrisphaera sp. DSM 44207]|uniref:DUF1800 domain-containing protein n=1 Tax=Quadrisphaera sp. DSM 44207 TaxID=1881057 RepID=UPI00087E4B58|nr:DUF1800 domain-containing protein [Quadrisphaera sp. DSM 44207]SDQ10083.1 Uncharacterized conserved protein, DUF1800 family [Quadrisphaera sp. DSM 44207]
MSPTPALLALRDRVRRHVPGALLPAPLSQDDVQHLVRRLTWGATPTLVEEVRRDPQAWLDAQLEPAAIDDAACDALVRRFGRLSWSIPQTRGGGSFGNYDSMWELGQATLARATWSRRQLLEVVCDFWSNHLNVTNPASDVWDNRHDYDATVIRPHALGSFDAMLLASARHPAMLRYLDNATNTRGAPNENYARELLELHTVGVDAGYGEEGVRAAARVLTGAAVDDATGLYRYDERRHDPGAAAVMGWSTGAHSAADGQRVQADLVRHLAHHPRTAATIARKLCVRFVADDPPAALVERLAATYLAQGTRVVPVLRQLFASPEFWAARRTKTRRPLEGFVAAVRAIGSTPGPSGLGGMDYLYWQARDIGMAPLAWAPPNGYPDVAVAWQSAGATMRRWNKTTEVVNGWWPADLRRGDLAVLLPRPLPDTFGEVVDALLARLLGRPATARERSVLLAFCERSAVTPLRADDEWITWRLPSVVQTVLHAPGHMER